MGAQQLSSPAGPPLVLTHDAVEAVLAWGWHHLRDLPWRRTRDPWLVLVSEVMLQQTQVDRVLPKWRAFIDAWPTPAACADASLADVLRQWHGLGYPRRARNLHVAARHVADAGVFPHTLPGLLALPGVGPYTARAVLAFAFESDAAVVDTNIARVYARVGGQPLTAKQVQAVANASAPTGQSWVWNQALMDVGAVLCRPSSPSCADCPLQTACTYRGAGADPAIGSAGVSSRQARFDGSDRQARGRLLAALTAGPVELDAVAATMRVGDTRARRLVEALRSEGLVHVGSDVVTLPE